jgi:ribulose kinase
VSNIEQTTTAEKIYLFIESFRRTPNMHRFLQVALLGAALMAAVATVPTALKAADDHPTRYHDQKHNDDHEWNDREDRAYQKWLEGKHHVKRDFAKLKAKEQREYWKWRHEHPDKD